MYKANPQVDIAFKKIFGTEENKDLLISLINSIISKEDQVSDVTLLNPYNPKKFLEDKLSILDIKAKALDGRLFNIEIQITDEADYDKRALYYWAKLYTEQLQESMVYSTLSKAIGIHILNFKSIIENKKYHNVFHITEKDEGFNYFKDLELHTIELPKFADNLCDDLNKLVAKIKSALDIWMAFLTKYNLLDKENIPKELKSKELTKALHILEVMHFTHEEREEYEGHLKFLRAEQSAIEKATNVGKSQGINIGIDIGKNDKAAEVAKFLLAQNLDNNLISNATGLSLEELAKLKNL